MALILVVDDNEQVGKTVGLALEGAGHDAIVVETLSKAEANIETGSVDGAIVDVWMDQDDGLDFAAKLARRDPPLPFVVMSGGGAGKTLEAVTARADSLGAAAVLYKPFDEDELVRAVDVMLER